MQLPWQVKRRPRAGSKRSFCFSLPKAPCLIFAYFVKRLTKLIEKEQYFHFSANNCCRGAEVPCSKAS